ncbi:Glutamate--cysteine ligase, chloroplastic [Morella rubra]|uniref:glutamate--cysteine ligase n=1 Tax=Morella rubra TaxID=262757 RepID=A0A6A1WK86_9ROSI|nr:Glutamate--cysteine ligase, chloroplastic [Morella rubra]
MAVFSWTVWSRSMLSSTAANNRDLHSPMKESGVRVMSCLPCNLVEPRIMRRSHGRGQRVIVGASPTEAALVPTKPMITKEDLVAYLASGCKPKGNWRIGAEHEKFGFDLGTLRPLRYEQIAELLHGIAERFDWDKVMEGDNIIGLVQGKQSISLEPGGQLELSGAPVETLHQTCAEINSHLSQVKSVAEKMGVGFLGIGFQPKCEIEDIPIIPKARFGIIRKYWPQVGSLARDVMYRTCTVQVK